MFKEFADDLRKLQKNVDEEFNKMAKRGAIHYTNTAKKFTDAYKKVDTGNYKRNWNAEAIRKGEGEYCIECSNNVEYASFLEDGYKIKEKHFIPFDKMEGSPKTKKLQKEFKKKYPGVKGFVAKPRRFTGLKIGRQSLNDLRGWVLNEFRVLIKRASMQR